MGGYNGGEVASKLAIDSVKKYIENNFEKEKETKESILNLIKSAIEYANMIVYKKSKEVKELEGKLTKDHSYVQKLIEDGTITREEAMTHPKKNMLMKALGCTPYVEPDVRARNYIVGDILIMCSDGLTNMVKEEEIYKTVIEDAVEAPKKLIEQANKLGGYDNITVITIL